MAKARVGERSIKMAIPKRVATKQRKKATQLSEEKLQKHKDSIAHLQKLQRDRQRHHKLKLLVQAVKKAKIFMLRKLMRKLKEATGDDKPALEKRLSLLKAMPHALVATQYLSEQGHILNIPTSATDNSATWDALRASQQKLCDTLVKQILASAQVQAQLANLVHKDAAADSRGTHSYNASPQDTTHSPELRPKESVSELVKKPILRSSKSQFDSRHVPNGSFAPCSTESSAAERKKTNESDGTVKNSKSPSSFTLASSSRLDELDDSEDKKGPRSARRKNIISRSGNRMGQRQRKALAERERAKLEGNTDGKRGVVSKRPHKSGRGEGSSGRMGSSRQQVRLKSSIGSNSTTTGGFKSVEEKLHPSWEAKKSLSAAIQPFRGKKVTFD